MGYFFDAPAFHKFADVRVLAGRCAEQLAVIHIRQRLDVTHIEQDRDQLFIDGMIFDLFPGNITDKFGRQDTLLPLIPI